MYMSKFFSGMRMRKGIEGQGSYEEADSSKRGRTGVEQPLKEREASYFRKKIRGAVRKF